MTPLTGRFAADFPRWSPDQLFRLAADIERYPDFIPWCKSARVLSEDGTERMVDNHFGIGPLDMHFLSRTVTRAPDSLDIAAADGPFQDFRLIWRFLPAATGCRVEADYQIAFRSPMLHGLAGIAIHEVERRVLKRFEERAAEVYGGGQPG
jgi:coenzyme Q-binding protein COQ10